MCTILRAKLLSFQRIQLATIPKSGRDADIDVVAVLCKEKNPVSPLLRVVGGGLRFTETPQAQATVAGSQKSRIGHTLWADLWVYLGDTTHPARCVNRCNRGVSLGQTRGESERTFCLRERRSEKRKLRGHNREVFELRTYLLVGSNMPFSGSVAEGMRSGFWLERKCPSARL